MLGLEISKFLVELLIAWNTKWLFFIIIKVAGIPGTFALWNEWGIKLQTKSVELYTGTLLLRIVAWLTIPHLFLICWDPVCWFEPQVLFDVLDSILQVPVAFRQVNLEQVAEHILQISSEVRWEANLQTNQSLHGNNAAYNYGNQTVLWLNELHVYEYMPIPLPSLQLCLPFLRQFSRRSGSAGQQRMGGILRPSRIWEHQVPTSPLLCCTPKQNISFQPVHTSLSTHSTYLG